MIENAQFNVVGLGAWGRGFSSWSELAPLLRIGTIPDTAIYTPPKPEVIPSNERRRAPLLVKMAVEVSAQALAQSGLPANQVACVFGSGLGDTDITDYMCRALTTEQKLLSPTKFHNSVHNAAAGYWTISSACMKSANSIAAYHYTFGLAFVEALTHCHIEKEPVLITLFDDKAHSAYRSVFNNEEGFACSVLVCPEKFELNNQILASLKLELRHTQALDSDREIFADGGYFAGLYNSNPSAKALALLLALAEPDELNRERIIPLALSDEESVSLRLTKN